MGDSGPRRKSGTALALIASCVVALGAAAPASAGILDQQQPAIHEDFGVDGTRVAGQTFTAGITGAPDQVDVALRHQFDPTCSPLPTAITAEVRTVASAEPTETVLASSTVAWASLPTALGFVSFGLQGAGAIVAGTQYAIVVKQIGGTASCTRAGIAGPPDPYSGGNLLRKDGSNPWEHFADRDLAFKTYVAPAPPPPPPPPPPKCSGREATIVGTEKGETLVGTANADVIAALGGKDTVKGLGDDDRICGGDGRDTLKGNAGADRLKGGGSSDVLKGGGGADKCVGGPGGDTAGKCEIERSI